VRLNIRPRSKLQGWNALVRLLFAIEVRNPSVNKRKGMCSRDHVVRYSSLDNGGHLIDLDQSRYASRYPRVASRCTLFNEIKRKLWKARHWLPGRCVEWIIIVNDQNAI
jgi:hypothetical protein